MPSAPSELSPELLHLNGSRPLVDCWLIRWYGFLVRQPPTLIWRTGKMYRPTLPLEMRNWTWLGETQPNVPWNVVVPFTVTFQTEGARCRESNASWAPVFWSERHVGILWPDHTDGRNCFFLKGVGVPATSDPGKRETPGQGVSTGQGALAWKSARGTCRSDVCLCLPKEASPECSFQGQ